MAEASNAFGTVTVEAENFETAKKIIELVNSFTENYNFYTCFDIEDISDSNRKAKCTFYADGRWEFQTNIQYLGIWIMNNADTPEAKLKVEELRKHNFKMTFDYYDEERSEPFICHAVASITHQANTPLKSIRYERTEHENYDYTVENLCKLFDYDLDYARECCGLDEEVA